MTADNEKRDIVVGEKWTGLLSFVCEGMQRRGDVAVQRTAVGELQLAGAGLTLVKNPHLRAKLADILSMFLPPRDPSDGKFRLERDHPFCHASLTGIMVPALLKLYSDVEYTGRHAQFYEKFGPREKINDILEMLWQYQDHRVAFEKISHEANNVDFERFLNTVISDSIFLLDESIKHLKTIRSIELLKDDATSWGALSGDQRQEKEKLFADSEGSAKWMMRLANTTFRLLANCVKQIGHAFTSEMFSERFAHMLDYYIHTLAPAKLRDINVRNKEKYHFKPQALLVDILLIFTGCCSDATFRKHVVLDARSFSQTTMQEILDLVRKRNWLQPADLVQLETCVSDLHATAAAPSDGLEEAEEDAPAEFLDPLTQGLMLVRDNLVVVVVLMIMIMLGARPCLRVVCFDC